MRNHIVKTGLVALAFAPLLAACGQENSGGGGGFVTVPSCGQNGQVLSTDSSGQLICKDLPTGTVTVPNCDPDLKALTSDGKSLFCADRNTVDANTSSALIKLQQLEKDVTTYNNIINMLGTGSSARARYVGSTTAMTTGRITSGAQVGVAAATAVAAAAAVGAAAVAAVVDAAAAVVAGAKASWGGAEKLGAAAADIFTLPVRAGMGIVNNAVRGVNTLGADLPYIPDSNGIISSMTPYSDMLARRDQPPQSAADAKALRDQLLKEVTGKKAK